MSKLLPEEAARYARQIILPEIGAAGQARLKAARVLLIGAGGLGCPAAQYLVGAGIGTLGIVDDDTVDRSNLQRQTLYIDAETGRPKAAAAVERLRALNPCVEVIPFQERFSAERALELLSKFDLVVDGSDNFATRYLVNDACVIAEKPFVAASVLGFRGQLGCFNVDLGGRRSGTYRCLFPEPPPPELAPSCAENGVLGAVPGILGTMLAAEALKLILRIGEPAVNRLLLFDALSATFTSIRFERDEQLAALTAQRPLISVTTDVCDRERPMITQITPAELKAKMDGKESFQLIDVREDFEKRIADIGGDLIPLATIGGARERIAKDRPVVVYCKAGGRSQRACEVLEKLGFTNLYNLRGGINAWAVEIDPSIKRY